MMFFTAHGGASGEGRILTNGMAVAAPVRRRRRVGRHLRHRQLGRDAGADFRRPRRSRDRRAEHQHRAQVGRQPVPRIGVLSVSGDWATSNNVDDPHAGYGITQPPALRSNWDVSGSLGGPLKHDRLWFFANVRAWANAAGRRRDLREPLRRRRVALGLRGGSVDRGPHRGVAQDLRGPPDGPADAAQPDHVLARLPAPLRRLVADERRRRLPPGGDDWIGSGRTFGVDTVSPESFPGYHDFPYNTTQATYSAPLSNRVLLEAGYSRFAYGYARFGMAAPDGLMDLIPVTEQSGIYGRTNLSYRGVFDPLDFGFNDNDALQSAWRASMSYVTGAHNVKVGYQGYFSEVHNGRVPNHQQLRYTFNNQVPISVSYFLSPRWDQHDRTETFSLYAQDQWTIGRMTLQGGVRFDRAWSWAPAEGNGTTLHVAIQPAADYVRPHGQRPRVQRHHAARRVRLRPVRQRQDGAQGQRRQVPRSGDLRRHLQLQQSGRAHRHARRLGRRQRGPRLDRRQPQLRRRLRPAQSGAAEQPRQRAAICARRSAATT